jgi:hypothetical protein
VIIRATPAGFPASASRTVTLSVNVRAAPTGSGNVILDWSGCKVPSWIAAQDGSGPWMQVLPVAGVARFNVTSTKGAFAYVEAGQTVVSYMTHAELTGRPMVMCPPPAPTKVVTGISAPTTTLSGEQATYYLGGGIGTSTAAAPNFTINGVADGVHDLVGWASGTVSGIRGYIERDIDVANGGSLGTVPWSGPGSFAPQRASLTFSGFFTGDVSGTFAMAYATTAACTVNPLFPAWSAKCLECRNSSSARATSIFSPLLRRVRQMPGRERRRSRFIRCPTGPSRFHRPSTPQPWPPRRAATSDCK